MYIICIILRFFFVSRYAVYEVTPSVGNLVFSLSKRGKGSVSELTAAVRRKSLRLKVS
jgi:hypothetical protein